MTDFFADSAPAGDSSFSVSDNAVKRIAFLIQQEEGDGLFLRVSVSGGGCSGFQYGFTFDDEIRGEDHVFERDGVKVVVDETSLGLMGGAPLGNVAAGLLAEWLGPLPACALAGASMLAVIAFAWRFSEVRHME